MFILIQTDRLINKMGEILILTSVDGRKLTNQLIDSWFDSNEMFITNKNFSDDHFSVEITFIDEESMKINLRKKKTEDFIFILRS